MAERWIELGRVGAPFGVRGWLHVESFAEPPQRLLELCAWRLRPLRGEAKSWNVAAARPHGRSFVAKLDGIETREAAAGLTGSVIEVERAELPPAGPREHYLADLVGLEVRNADGERLGRVDHFVEAPANAVMVVLGEREHWIPLSPRHLLKVERETGGLVVDWPADF